MAACGSRASAPCRSEVAPERTAIGLDWGVETFATIAHEDMSFNAVANPHFTQQVKADLERPHRPGTECRVTREPRLVSNTKLIPYALRRRAVQGKYPAMRVAARRTSFASANVTGVVARASGAARLSAPYTVPLAPLIAQATA